jgi:hypothetical protein
MAEIKVEAWTLAEDRHRDGFCVEVVHWNAGYKWIWNKYLYIYSHVLVGSEMEPNPLFEITKIDSGMFNVELPDSIRSLFHGEITYSKPGWDAEGKTIATKKIGDDYNHFDDPEDITKEEVMSDAVILFAGVKEWYERRKVG